MRKHFNLERAILLAIICFVAITNSLPSIVGFLSTPPNYKFLGTVHYPWDYYYYLSQFTQGKESPFFGTDLYTGEYKSYNMLEWVNMFLGFTFAKIGFEPIMAYQLVIFIFTLIFLLVSYKLIRQLYPREKDWIIRIFFLLLFIFNNSFAGYDFYLSVGPAFNRLGGVPHHLLARTFHLLFIYLFLKWQQDKQKDAKKRIPELILCALAGFISASIDPVQFAVLGAGALVGFIIYRAAVFKSTGNMDLKTTIFGLTPLLVFGATGAPMVFYLRNILFNPPYNQSIIWGAKEQVRVTLPYFLLSGGPVALLSIISMVVSVKKMNLQKILASALILLPMALFFSGIPLAFNSANSRVVSAMMIFAMTYLALDLLVDLVSKCGRFRFIAAGILVAGAAFFLLPTYANQLILRMKLDPLFSYIPQNDYNTLVKIKAFSGPNDTILADLPFNWFIPAIAGRRVFDGHQIMTYDQVRKEKLRSDFFDNRMDKKERRAFLEKEGIDYIFAYKNEKFFNDLPAKEIYTDGHLSLYKISKI